jgi:uncharacterized protein YbjT (DUF2867 family)
MKILVIGGTGTVGSSLVETLLGRGADVRVMSRHLGARSGAEYVSGDLASPETLGSSFERVSKLYLLTPLDRDETELGMNAVRAASDHGLRHIVFQSIHRAEQAQQIPHFRTKVEILEGIKESGIPYTVLAPNNFYQNDAWLQEPIMQYGVYGAPIGNVGLSRVDVRDIADAAAATLLAEGHEGRSYALVGPDVLTGDECAAMWTSRLGRDVRYGGDDLDAWAEQASSMMPDWLVDDVRVMFDYFQQHGLRATNEEVGQLTMLLGRPPRSYEAFVAETAQSWQGEG